MNRAFPSTCLRHGWHGLPETKEKRPLLWRAEGHAGGRLSEQRVPRPLPPLPIARVASSRNDHVAKMASLRLAVKILSGLGAVIAAIRMLVRRLSRGGPLIATFRDTEARAGDSAWPQSKRAGPGPTLPKEYVRKLSVRPWRQAWPPVRRVAQQDDDARHAAMAGRPARSGLRRSRISASDALSSS